MGSSLKVAAARVAPQVRGQANSCVRSLDSSAQRPRQSRPVPCPLERALAVAPEHDAARCLQGRAVRIVATSLVTALRVDKQHDWAATDPLDDLKRSPVAVAQASHYNQKSAVPATASMEYGRCYQRYRRAAVRPGRVGCDHSPGAMVNTGVGASVRIVTAQEPCEKCSEYRRNPSRSP